MFEKDTIKMSRYTLMPKVFARNFSSDCKLLHAFHNCSLILIMSTTMYLRVFICCTYSKASCRVQFGRVGEKEGNRGVWT